MNTPARLSAFNVGKAPTRNPVNDSTLIASLMLFDAFAFAFAPSMSAALGIRWVCAPPPYITQHGEVSREDIKRAIVWGSDKQEGSGVSAGIENKKDRVIDLLHKALRGNGLGWIAMQR